MKKKALCLALALVWGTSIPEIQGGRFTSPFRNIWEISNVSQAKQHASYLLEKAQHSFTHAKQAQAQLAKMDSIPRENTGTDGVLGAHFFLARYLRQTLLRTNVLDPSFSELLISASKKGWPHGSFHGALELPLGFSATLQSPHVGRKAPFSLAFTSQNLFFLTAIGSWGIGKLPLDSFSKGIDPVPSILSLIKEVCPLTFSPEEASPSLRTFPVTNIHNINFFSNIWDEEIDITQQKPYEKVFRELQENSKERELDKVALPFVQCARGNFLLRYSAHQLSLTRFTLDDLALLSNHWDLEEGQGGDHLLERAKNLGEKLASWQQFNLDGIVLPPIPLEYYPFSIKHEAEK